MGGDHDLVDIDLSDEEWNLLYQGVLQLGGPTALDDAISRAIGYRDTAELREHWSTLLHAVKERRALSPHDWQWAQIATEVSFASNYYGAAGDWEACSMLDDAMSIRLLRQVQRKLITTVGRAERAPRGASAAREVVLWTRSGGASHGKERFSIRRSCCASE